GPASQDFGQDLQWISLRRVAGTITGGEIGAVPLRMRGACALHFDAHRSVVLRLLYPPPRRQGLRRNGPKELLGKAPNLEQIDIARDNQDRVVGCVPLPVGRQRVLRAE